MNTEAYVTLLKLRHKAIDRGDEALSSEFAKSMQWIKNRMLVPEWDETIKLITPLLTRRGESFKETA